LGPISLIRSITKIGPRFWWAPDLIKLTEIAARKSAKLPFPEFLQSVPGEHLYPIHQYLKIDLLSDFYPQGHSAKMSLWYKNQVKLLYSSHFLWGVPGTLHILWVQTDFLRSFFTSSPKMRSVPGSPGKGAKTDQNVWPLPNLNIFSGTNVLMIQNSVCFFFVETSYFGGN
jgi:hypothetical protein